MLCFMTIIILPLSRVVLETPVSNIFELIVEAEADVAECQMVDMTKVSGNVEETTP